MFKWILKKAIIILAVMLVFGVLVFWIVLARNPLTPYGVHIEWRDAGATPDYPWIEVWAEQNGKRFACPLLFGGMEHPELRFEDIDHDQIPDIIFFEGGFRQVVAFKPAQDGQEPRFVILEDNPPAR